MDVLGWIVLVVCGLGVAIFLYMRATKKKELPNVLRDWFGHGEPQIITDTSIREFKVKVSDDILKDLTSRLANTRFGEGFVADFSYGMRVDYMKDIVNYWKDSYDWRKQEDILNRFPQYKTNIQGIDVHFIRVKPTKAAKGI